MVLRITSSAHPIEPSPDDAKDPTTNNTKEINKTTVPNDTYMATLPFLILSRSLKYANFAIDAQALNARFITRSEMERLWEREVREAFREWVVSSSRRERGNGYCAGTFEFRGLSGLGGMDSRLSRSHFMLPGKKLFVIYLGISVFMVHKSRFEFEIFRFVQCQALLLLFSRESKMQVILLSVLLHF